MFHGFQLLGAVALVAVGGSLHGLHGQLLVDRRRGLMARHVRGMVSVARGGMVGGLLLRLVVLQESGLGLDGYGLEDGDDFGQVLS